VTFALKAQRHDRIPGAEFSACRRYRYLLRWPTGVDDDRICLWVLANPSTATAERVDPTIRRCINWARNWGYGWMWAVNARAWRETHPRELPNDPKAIGPLNDEWILAAAESSDLIVCGWGKLGGKRGRRVAHDLRRSGVRLHALRVNRDGSPVHPLYLPGNSVPVAFQTVVGGVL
jgi:hypothetical protein